MYLRGREIELDIVHLGVSQQMQDDIALCVNTDQPFGLRGKYATIIFDTANKRSLRIGSVFNRPNTVTTYPSDEEMFAAISLNLFGKKTFISYENLLGDGLMKFLPGILK